MQEEKLLDVQHVAARLDVNPRTIMRMVERGELPAFKVAHRLRFRSADLERYLHTHLSTTSTSATEDAYHQAPAQVPLPTQDGWLDAGEESASTSAAQTSTSQTARRSMLAAQLKLEKQQLEIDQQRIELQKQLLDLHTRRVDHALESANRAVTMLNMLPPEVDSHTKTLFLKSLLPGLLQQEYYPDSPK